MAKGVQQAMKCQTILLSSLLLMTFADTALAQGWPPWADDAFHDRRSSRPQPNYYQDTPEPLRRPYADAVQDGGPRPAITPRTPAVVEFTATFPANSIVIDTGKRKLYYVLEGNRAYEYRISVGREGFNWSGTETVSRKQAWPDWHPPAEMRERDPKLPEKMTGGARNPLGAMALYLGNTLYRIHGTNDVKSIGQAQSSGCFPHAQHGSAASGLGHRGRHACLSGDLPRRCAGGHSEARAAKTGAGAGARGPFGCPKARHNRPRPRCARLSDSAPGDAAQAVAA
jgi:hypothetical protein